MERIHVSVRPRPLSPEDAKSSPWRISANSIFIPNQSSKFDFDRVFGEESINSEVYSCRTKDIVEAAVRGFNGTVFAYGQTSSGKTHTMRGSASEPGVIPLAVHDLFERIYEEVDREFLLRMSYMEIYNEEINDLLAPEHRKLQIHESIERGIFVAGLREEIVASPDQVLGFMEFGESHRHIGETNMNLYSSRSHTIFRMIIESKEKTEDLENSCDAVRVSVLNLVDLAGSERAAKTGAEGVRLKEGSHINKSLMTLGTVIKKLSEGVESQGGHVPYRDSKLTRILQPALGGNANTAIICNITLAQIHADETKSSLLFASRALHVTNCAHVNEILTDAALLKRQKKEIEELRAKLLGNMGSHSEHLEDEVLNLRNALLKAELERERIALELEEEKRAHAERDKRLQEQARKIENLSSMVLCSTRSESHDTSRKEKRRLTWCPGKMSKETWNEPYSTVEEEASVVKPGRKARDVAPLLPFEDLVKESVVKPGRKARDVAPFLPFEDPVKESRVADPCTEEEERKISMKEDSILPNPVSLLHVTSRRKAAPKKKNLRMENNESAGTQLQYDDLLVKYETERAKSGMELDHLKKRLALASVCHDERHNDSFTGYDNVGMDQSVNQMFTETEAICLIKQLQDKITLLQTEKSFSQKNLDSVVELASEQTMAAREKYEELYSALQEAKEEVKIAHELNSWPLDGEGQCSDSFFKLVAEIQELLSESRNLTEFASSDMGDFCKYLSGVPSLLADLRSSALQASDELRTTISCYKKLNCSLESRVNRLENEKMTLNNQSRDLQNQIEELSSSVQNSANALVELSEEYGLEQSELLAHIKVLEKEISSASSCSLAREKESLRKELEKVKSKLRDTEAKLKNSMQEKTKLEGEKACAEKENKLLRNQKNTLERDLSKHDSVFGKRGDLFTGNSANMSDTKRGWSPAMEIDLEDYKNLEELASEMEIKIASLEEELMVARTEKEEAISKAESLSCELNALSEEFNMTSAELTKLEEETSTLKSCIKESESQNQDLQSSINTIMEEKEELAMQLTDALLLLEEEKAIWSAKEKASMESIEQKVKLHNSEVNALLKEVSEVKKELECYRSECQTLEDRWRHSVEELELEKKGSAEKSLEIDRLREDVEVFDNHSRKAHESLTSQLNTLSLEHQRTCDELKRLQTELENNLQKEREERLSLDGNSSLSNKQAVDEVIIIANKEKAKMRMRLRSTQIKLDTIRYRYKEVVNEMDVMNTKYEKASVKLKDQAVSYGVEVMKLRKHLSACTCTT